MINSKIENPLEKIQEQMEKILFVNTDVTIKENNVDVSFKITDSSNFNIKKFKRNLIFLMKELKAKSIYLVA